VRNIDPLTPHQTFSRHRIFIALSLLLLGLYLSASSLFRSGYYNDDAANQLMWAFMKARDLDRLPTRLYYYFVKCEWEAGRFYPLYGLVYLLFNTIHDMTWVRDVLLYKAYIVASIGLNFGLMMIFLKRLSGSWAPGLWMALLMPTFFQFRSFYDPILSFHAFLPALLSLTLLSLILLDRFLTEGRKRDLVMSVVAYLVSLLIYEMTYVFGIFQVLLLWHYRVRLAKSLRVIACYLGALAVPVAGNFLVRAKFYQGLPDTYKMRFELGPYFLLLAKQVYAAFPLSYYLSDPHALFAGGIQGFLERLRWVDGLCLLAFGFLLRSLLKWPRDKGRIGFYFSFGVAFLILPAALIAMSPTYQYLIRFGFAHLPVYIQCFGAGLCLVGLLQWLQQKLVSSPVRQAICGGIGLLMAAVLLLNLQNNRTVVETRNEKEGWNVHNALFLASRHGLFANIPPNSTFIYGNVAFNAYDFMHYALLNKKTPFFQLRDIPPASPPKGEVYVMKSWAASVDRGYVFLVKVSGFRIDAKSHKAFIKPEKVTVFLLGSDLTQAQVVQDSTRLPLRDWARPTENAQVVDLGQSALTRTRDWVDLSSIRLNIAPEAENN
jgi:hypothetical protein